MPNFEKFFAGYSFQNLKGTIFNFACRSLGIFAKFLLVVYISKNMSFEALGLYNIVAVTVAWSVYVIGFEFYAFSLRHIVGETTQIISSHVFNQVIFHLAGYSILFVLCPVLVGLDFVPLALLPYFIFITIFDQLSQECFRICVALERSQFANFIHLVKSGLWVYPLLLLPIVFNQSISVHLILGSWLVGTVMAFVIGALKLSHLGVLNFKGIKLNIDWIKQGIVVAFPFLIISISQLTMDFSDRYLIDYFLGKADVGIYSFYYGIASVPITLITSVLVSQYYSRIINVYKFETPESERQTQIRRFLFQCVGLAILCSIGALILIQFLLNFIGRQQLIDHIDLFYLMLVQVLLFSFQVVIQTVLYARHDDKYLLYSALGAAVLNILINLILIPVMGINGAALATIVSMSLMLATRFFRLKKLQRNAR
jgi:O-antigen/teichoic acid export membrane protein